MSDRADPPRPTRLAHLTWPEASAWFRRDPRLIVPVGSCLQHGPHLPLVTDTLIVEAVAGGIAARYRILLAPTLPFGSGSAREDEYAGTASLRSKTLHRVLNELLTAWEEQGVEQVVLMTAHGFRGHVAALLSVVSRARIRVVDVKTADVSRFLSAPDLPDHAGELETSLLLHLAPELVRRDEIRDHVPPDPEWMELLEGSQAVPPEGSPGVVGRPTEASAEKGRQIYEHLVEHIGSRLFGEDGAAAADAD